MHHVSSLQCGYKGIFSNQETRLDIETTGQWSKESQKTNCRSRQQRMKQWKQGRWF